ncbi:MAG: formyltransferase family protein [Oceanicaulis sp.]
MTTLILSPYPEALGIEDAVVADPDGDVLAQAQTAGAEHLVVYGWRKILRGAVLERYAGRIVNLHISLLPHNRGADPNFWSWFDATPKGVSVHLIDAGVDTGPVLIQAEAQFSPGPMTLASTYAVLRTQVESLFNAAWPDIRAGRLAPRAQPAPGPRPRKAAEKTVWMSRLSAGWDTPVSEVEALGRQARREREER